MFKIIKYTTGLVAFSGVTVVCAVSYIILRAFGPRASKSIK